MKWILASGSPRRQQLLCQITEDFSVLPSQIEERRDPSWTAQELPRQLAAQKALDVSSRNPAALVIGADTIVSLDGTVLGKPRDEADAADMLRSLSGRTHQVYTGVAFCRDGKAVSYTHLVHQKGGAPPVVHDPESPAAPAAVFCGGRAVAHGHQGQPAVSENSPGQHWRHGGAVSHGHFDGKGCRLQPHFL